VTSQALFDRRGRALSSDAVMVPTMRWRNAPARRVRKDSPAVRACCGAPSSIVEGSGFARKRRTPASRPCACPRAPSPQRRVPTQTTASEMKTRGSHAQRALQISVRKDEYHSLARLLSYLRRSIAYENTSNRPIALYRKIKTRVNKPRNRSTH